MRCSGSDEVCESGSADSSLAFVHQVWSVVWKYCDVLLTAFVTMFDIPDTSGMTLFPYVLDWIVVQDRKSSSLNVSLFMSRRLLA